jgi:hypothetical protein
LEKSILGLGAKGAATVVLLVGRTPRRFSILLGSGAVAGGITVLEGSATSVEVVVFFSTFNNSGEGVGVFRLEVGTRDGGGDKFSDDEVEALPQPNPEKRTQGSKRRQTDRVVFVKILEMNAAKG